MGLTYLFSIDCNESGEGWLFSVPAANTPHRPELRTASGPGGRSDDSSWPHRSTVLETPSLTYSRTIMRFEREIICKRGRMFPRRNRGPRRDPDCTRLPEEGSGLVGDVEAHHDGTRTTDGSSGGAKVGGIVRTACRGGVRNGQTWNRAGPLRRAKRKRQR
jgi:hypothetical protein